MEGQASSAPVSNSGSAPQGGSPASEGTSAPAQSSPQGGGDAGGQSQQSQQSSQPWYGSFGDDNKAYIETKGFKDPESVVESYRHFEKLHGVPKEQLLKLPKDDSPEAWGEVYDRLGRPKSAEDYDFSVLGEDRSEAFDQMMAPTFHEAGLTKSQADTVLGKIKEFTEHVVSESQANRQESLANQEADLKKQWGAAYEKEVNRARLAAQGLGIDQDTVSVLERAMGFDGVMKFFNQIGQKIGEDNFISGDTSGNNFGGMTPAAADAKIRSLIRDKDFQSRMKDGDVKAKAEWDRLHRWKHGQRA